MLNSNSCLLMIILGLVVTVYTSSLTNQEVIADDSSEAGHVELSDSQIEVNSNLEKDGIEELKQPNKIVPPTLNDLMSKTNIHEFTRERRRLTIFKNIYHQCRIQKRKDRELCLYLANLYQNLKGFHGL